MEGESVTQKIQKNVKKDFLNSPCTEEQSCSGRLLSNNKRQSGKMSASKVKAKKTKKPDKVDWTRKIKVKEKVVQKGEQNDSDPVD